MTNNFEITSRIIMGEELGNTYIVYQKLVNGKVKKFLENKYIENEVVENRIADISKKGISDIVFNYKKDLMQFRLEDDSTVCIMDYSKIDENSKLKVIKNRINRILLLQRIDDKFCLIKEKGKKVLTDKKLAAIISATIALGVIGVPVEALETNTDNFNYELQKMISETTNPILDRLIETTISDHKLSQNYLNQINNETIDDIGPVYFRELSNMYYLSEKTVEQIYYNNYNEIVNSENAHKELLLKVKDAFYSDWSIDKTPVVTNMSDAEKENCIVDIARKVYKVDDKETLEILLAIYRFETYYGTSDRCVYDNNPGGLKENGAFLNFKTFEIGAESFVRNTLKIKNKALANYNYDLSLIGNMQMIYCENNAEWTDMVEYKRLELKEEKVLDSYIDNDKGKVLVYK